MNFYRSIQGMVLGCLGLCSATPAQDLPRAPSTLRVAALSQPAALSAGPAAQVLRAEAPRPAGVFEALKRAEMSDQDIVLLARPVGDDSLPPLFAHREHQSMTLASTTKLITTLAALDTLGPKYRWRTRAYLDGQLHQGVLYGDLRIVGGGDARLSSGELVEWFKLMRQRGLAEIRGHIVLDRQAFHLSDSDHANTPPPSAGQPRHNRPDALWVDAGRVRVDVAGTAAGVPQAMLLVPGSDIELDNQLLLRRTACVDLRYRPRLSLDESATPMRAVLTGEWAVDCTPLRLEVAPVQGARFVTRMVAAAWHAAGGQLDGSVLDAQGDAGPLALPRKPWLVLESPELGDLIREMNKSSDNLMARHLMLSLADRFPSRPATLDSARRRVDQWLRRGGLSDEDLHVDNGSGLSYAERGRASAMVQLLQRAWGSETAQVFRDSLPLAGKDGTLVNRLRHLDAGTEASLKTGSLSQTRALAGYVRARSGRVYAMAAIINHAFAARGEPALDAFVEWVVKNG